MSNLPIKVDGPIAAVVLNLRDKWAATPSAALASVDALAPRQVKGDDHRVAAAAMRLLERFLFLVPAWTLDAVRFGGAPGMFRPGPRWAEAVAAAEAVDATAAAAHSIEHMEV